MKLNNKILLFLTFCWPLLTFAQTNLLSDPSFDNDKSRWPKQNSQLKRCGSWKHYRHNYPSLLQTETTSDWYRIDPDYFQGGYACDTFPAFRTVRNGGLDSALYTPIPPHDDAYYAGIYYWPTLNVGEAAQQKLSAPVTKGFYDFSFWYFPYCDTLEMTVSLWFTTKKHHRGQRYKAFTVTLPNDSGFAWTEFQRQIYIPNLRNYDWFFLQIEEAPSAPWEQSVYLFVDDFFLAEADCDLCGPTGQMAVNRYHPPFFSPNGDDYNEAFCVTNINNAQRARLTVYDRLNVEVWRQDVTNHEGLYNYDICWPGTRQNGSLTPADAYYPVLQLWNCDTEREVYYTVSHCGGVPCAAEPVPTLPSAIQEVFHHPPPPFAHEELRLYGHHPETDTFRACSKILVGDMANLITRIFTSDTLSTDLSLIAGELIDITGNADLSGTIDLMIDSTIECCPYWLQNKMQGTVLSLDTLSPQFILNSTNPLTWEDGMGKPFPNPFREKTRISWTLGAEGKVEVIIYDLHQNPIAVLVDEILPAGSFEVDFQAKLLPPGLYFCKLVTERTVKVVSLILLR